MPTAMESIWDPTEVQVIGDIFANDPYLAYQPAFAYTLPIQLLVNGMTLTLLCVLLLHLLCMYQTDIAASVGTADTCESRFSTTTRSRRSTMYCS